MLVAGVISGALLYIKDDFEVVKESSFLQVQASKCYNCAFLLCRIFISILFLGRVGKYGFHVILNFVWKKRGKT